MNDFFRFRRQGCPKGLSGKDFRFRLPATFCKIKVSGSKTVGGVATGVTVLINLVWIDMHTERAFIWLGSICLDLNK